MRVRVYVCVCMKQRESTRMRARRQEYVYAISVLKGTDRPTRPVHQWAGSIKMPFKLFKIYLVQLHSRGRRITLSCCWCINVTPPYGRHDAFLCAP